MGTKEYFDLEDSLPREIIKKFDLFCFTESNHISFDGKKCGGWDKCCDCLKCFADKHKEGN